MNTDRSSQAGLLSRPSTLGPGARCPTAAQRWLARLSLLLATLAVVILVVFAELDSLAILAVGLGGAAVSLTAAYFFLSRRGVRRWLSLGAFILTPIVVIIIFAFAHVSMSVETGPRFFIQKGPHVDVEKSKPRASAPSIAP